ncbi:hypothetical protein HELRODRAFT_185444 [Helobdella robusta]|uniref:Eukaryotic translation initiation factor 3 subunit L n=1 Tax=Helobdella robusta TaxID=6412 RepID=T1FMU1_HELRO|nr:hypothetical protein HELRODRAFT_185444 [Helobdella robusta]ESO07694.1 hypothetical protein HELRODRAFT_185444 [Helobdella robusta]
MWHASEVYPDTEYDQQNPYAYQAGDYGMHTGDPHQDLEYDRQYMQKGSFILPEVIKSFLVYFQKSIHDQDVFEIQNAYENGFNKLTERFFSNSPWPEAEDVAKYIQNDGVFLILYKELYYRHIYAKFTPTFNQRIESFQNYCHLFNLIIDAKHPVSLVLPNQWLWDIIDEFIYQYQTFSQFCSKVSKKKDEEIEMLRNNPSIWNVHQVLNVLHALVEKSNINQQLDALVNGENADPVAGEFGKHDLYKMLGYFSLVGLLRLHSLHGDYYLALKVIEKINFNRKSSYSRVSTCHITTCYYVGFAYMMMRRYQDAIRTFTNILLFIQKTKQHFQSKTYLYDQINKQNDQMFTLLAICLTLHPMSIDETVSSHLREKFAEKISKMQKGDLQEFESSFQFACPKFLFPHAPNWDIPLHPNYYKEPHNQQLSVFLREVVSQQLISTIRSFLKLYTTMPVSKLANFMDMKESELMSHLMCFKHKMQNLVWTKGVSGLEGEFQSASEVDFYIDKDMIHIADTKVERRYGDFFIMNIQKFQELTQQLRKHTNNAAR